MTNKILFAVALTLSGVGGCASAQQGAVIHGSENGAGVHDRSAAELPASPSQAAQSAPEQPVARNDSEPTASLPIAVMRTDQHVRLNLALQHLEEARRIAPDEPSVYYNEGILLQEYSSFYERDEVFRARNRASEMLTIFVRLAGPSPELAAEVKLATERIEKLQPGCYFGQTWDQRKLEESERAMAAAQAEAREAGPEEEAEAKAAAEAKKARKGQGGAPK